ESFKKWRMDVVTVALFGVVVCGSAQAEELPEADVVIQKYVEALGGEEKLTASKSRVTKGVFALPDFGMTGDITTWVAPPNMYSEITLDTLGSIQRGIKDGLAWELNPMQGATIHEGAQQKNMEREAAF